MKTLFSCLLMTALILNMLVNSYLYYNLID